MPENATVFRVVKNKPDNTKAGYTERPNLGIIEENGELEEVGEKVVLPKKVTIGNTVFIGGTTQNRKKDF